jgi:hypothetical protein
MNNKAYIRQKLEALPYVSQTWFEWRLENDTMVKALVIEVTFDTDPSLFDSHHDALAEIESTAKDLLAETIMVISHIRIIPRLTP